ncbi:hypothetical protein RRG08_057336 [Elysia crispata]|uniref:Uncharacterized protein n=1 Tax=Elysia crispata TaxID=231223 RepID=A0AAE1CZR2_9GAST|nr:hypothetical protein RRG08_057336 [Elysia crispata]
MGTLDTSKKGLFGFRFNVPCAARGVVNFCVAKVTSLPHCCPCPEGTKIMFPSFGGNEKIKNRRPPEEHPYPPKEVLRGGTPTRIPGHGPPWSGLDNMPFGHVSSEGMLLTGGELRFPQRFFGGRRQPPSTKGRRRDLRF